MYLHIVQGNIQYGVLTLKDSWQRINESFRDWTPCFMYIKMGSVVTAEIFIQSSNMFCNFAYGIALL